MNFELVKVADIEVGERHRKDMGDLQSLAASIDELGLLHPIGIDVEDHLLFGERRLVACRDVLGWVEIPAQVFDTDRMLDYEWVENDERKQLSISERAALWNAMERRRGAGRPEIGSGDPIIGQDEAARRAGFGGRKTANRAGYIVNHAPRDVVDAVDQGELKVYPVHEALKAAAAAGKPIESVKQLRSVIKEVAKQVVEAAVGPLPAKEPKGSMDHVKGVGKDWIEWISAVQHIADAQVDLPDLVLRHPSSNEDMLDEATRAVDRLVEWLSLLREWSDGTRGVAEADTGGAAEVRPA